MSKLLSVIVPVYNVESYLPTCIESIINQTYSNLELFLVDDGSTDKSGEICDEYAKKDSRIMVIHKENGGQGSARNRALDIAKGEYIAFVDSDDHIELNMYDAMINALERTDSDLVLCGFYTDSGLRIVDSIVPEKEMIFESDEELLRKYFDSPFVGGQPWNKVFKSSVFDELRFPEGTAREDVYIMHLALSKCKRAVHCGKRLYHYIVRDGSSEHQAFNPKVLISIKIAEDRHKFIKDNYPALSELSYKTTYGSRISAIKKIVRSDSVKQYKDIYDELVDFLRKNPAPTKEQAKLRRLIVCFPVIYKLKMDIRHKYRKKIKKFIFKLMKKK